MLHKCHFLELLSILYGVSSWFEKSLILGWTFEGFQHVTTIQQLP